MRHVLVFQLARFGDLVQSKRLLLSLAAEEQTQVHLCLDSSLAPLARIVYPFAELHPLPAGAGGTAQHVFGEAKALFTRFAQNTFERVYFLNFSPLSFACASLFDPEQCRGYARVDGQAMSGRWPLLMLNMLRDRRFSCLNLADAWAAFHPAPIAPEKVNPIARAAGSKRIGLVMAGRVSRRSLPPPVLAACVQAVFQGRGGPEIVCIGSAAERPLVRRLLRCLPDVVARKTIDRTGATALTDLPELLRGFDMLLTPDTGTMHLAAHLGVPVQAFFLSSAWCYETGPYGLGHKVWQALEDCSPCLESEPCKRLTAGARERDGSLPSCLSAFSHKGFLSHLAGKYNTDWPENLLGCTSFLDDLGVSYKAVDGNDPYQLGRAELRKGLLSYLSPPPFAAPAPGMRRELADFLFTESDWMLPGNWPRA